MLLELHVSDFAKVHEFYGALGFEIVRTEPDYLVLRRGESILNFYGGSEKIFSHSFFGRYPDDSVRGYGVEIVLFEAELFEYYERILSTAAFVSPPISPPTLRPWGVWDFRIADPFGYYLRISQPYDPSAAALRPTMHITADAGNY